MNVFEELKKIIQSAFPETDLDSITENSSLKKDLGLDSLGMMMVAILIEERFGIQFEGELQFKTVKDICTFLEEKIS